MDDVGSGIKQEELHITDFGYLYVEDAKVAGNLTIPKIERDNGLESPVHLTTSHVLQNRVKLEQVESNDCNLQRSEFLNTEREWRDEELSYQYQNPTEDPLALPLEDVLCNAQHDTKPPTALPSVKTEREDVSNLRETRVKREFDCNTEDDYVDTLATEPSNGVGGKKRRRSSYTADFKRRAIAYAETSNNSAAARAFDIDEKCVRSWRAQREALAACPGARRAFRGPRRGRHPQLEAEVAQYVLRLRGEGRPPTSGELRAEAQAIAGRRGLSPGTFVASRRWAQNLMRRSGLSLGPRSRQRAAPAPSTAIL